MTKVKIMEEDHTRIIESTDVSTKGRQISLNEAYKIALDITKGISSIKKPITMDEVFISQSTADDGDIECISITIIHKE